MKRKLMMVTILAVLLSCSYSVFADDVNVTVDVVEHPAGSSGWFDYILHQIGDGTGNLLNAIGSPLVVLIILMALGSALGYLFTALSETISGT